MIYLSEIIHQNNRKAKAPSTQKSIDAYFSRVFPKNYFFILTEVADKHSHARKPGARILFIGVC